MFSNSTFIQKEKEIKLLILLKKGKKIIKILENKS